MIKIGSNYLSLKNTSVEDFIRTAYDLRLDVVDFHQRAFESTDPGYLGKIQSALSPIRSADRVYRRERFVSWDRR